MHSGGEVVISIHALREEGDHGDLAIEGEAVEFLSTPSARRATRGESFLHMQIMISIHALREEGDGVALGVDGGAVISIHALREEGDTVPQIYC